MGGFVRSTPKYVPRDHPQYDVMVPKAARGKTNLYCAHPDTFCPGGASSPNSCYLYRQDQQPWEVARDTCYELGGYLVAIETPSELSSIREDVLTAHYEITTFSQMWIGLNDRSTEGVYTWERVGVTLSPASDLWNGGQPNDHSRSNQNCVSFNGAKFWDNPCTIDFSYICEFGL
ncbi:brevican core protein-like [Diadema antillarum]|uniref:brevican core protein-like n=1 Tax=Diadema antillarum TaxID=105358 RepID=UPI003A8426B6